MSNSQYLTSETQMKIEDRGWHEATGDWQVIFRTHAGKDYCRETKPGTMTHEAVVAWAEEMCKVHNLAGAFIERW